MTPAQPIPSTSEGVTMVERVARALHSSQRRPPTVIRGGFDLQSWDALLPREKEAFRNGAFEAIEALREPTEAMLQPACSGHTPGVPMPSTIARGDPEECYRFQARRRIWASMIDSILSEEG